MIPTFEQFLVEAASGIRFFDIKNLLIRLGYKYVNNHPDHKFSKCLIDKDGNSVPLTVMAHLSHTKPDQATVNPKFIQFIKDKINMEYAITGNDSIYDKIPWEKWKLNNPKNSIVKPKVQDYEVVDKLFGNICVIKNDKGEFNICRSEEDKNPLLATWWQQFKYCNTSGDPCLGFDNEDMDDINFGTNLYKILPNGTLDSKVIVESLKRL